MSRAQLLQWLVEERASILEQLSEAPEEGQMRNLQGRAQMLKRLIADIDNDHR